MRKLLGDRFAPVTDVLTLVEVDLRVATDFMRAWRRELYGDAVTDEPLCGGLETLLPHLEPLTQGALPRELLISASGWTAYFNSTISLDRTAADVLSEGLGVRGVRVVTSPHNLRGGRLGSVQFSLDGPDNPGDWMNRIRSIGAHFESRWEWYANGVVQPFEETEQYTNRRIRDRLTTDMVERYCQALGVDIFNPDFYGPHATLFTHHNIPWTYTQKTLTQVQQDKHIDPTTP